jgi:methyltransferase (TIGR00027 family)
VPASFRYPFEGDVSPRLQAAARQTLFDDVVRRYLPDVDQLVVLGAGFDTRSIASAGSVRSYEVDTPKTQAVKVGMLERAGIDASGVTFVPADFEHEDWWDRLLGAGFDPARSTLFVWEGVVMYLDRQSVEHSLERMASAAAGSAVAFDYVTTEPLESSGVYARYARAATKAAGEPLTFGIDSRPPVRDRVEELVASCGLHLAEHRAFGADTDGEPAWGGFAVATTSG